MATTSIGIRIVASAHVGCARGPAQTSGIDERRPRAAANESNEPRERSEILKKRKASAPVQGNADRLSHPDARNLTMRFALEEVPRTRPADRLCEGCYHPVSDVGFLSELRLTLRNAQTSTVNYCHDCCEIADAAALNPNEPYGALGLRADLLMVERVAVFPLAFPTAVAPTEHFGKYRIACQKPMRAWVHATIADLLTYPADEHDARCVAEEYATREILRPLEAHEARLLAEVVRDLLTARNTMAGLVG
jgi:hypothetical protein